MTEDEAKTKWCPYARVVCSGIATSGNRDFETPNLSESHPKFIEAVNCIGSGCMAWRELKGVDPNDDHPFDAPQIVIGGYCGLAGKP